MHKPGGTHLTIFFTIALVLAGCFIMGCSSTPPAMQPNKTPAGTDFGFRPVTALPDDQQALSFKESTADLAGLYLDAGSRSAPNTSPGNQILYIRGNNLNANGDARSWTFVVRHNNRTSLVTYDLQGRKISEWMGNFSRKEIQLDSIIPPDELFLKNRPAIIGDTKENLTESRDLVLSMDSYTLTVSGRDAKRILVFDAKTGIPLRSNG
ncbi:hypothetical protein [uncultured Methanoregula sp.]|uniref:hypothetical protein n=1 Tax=uncultured Methanoregula sp. TaxID=1005933 RepID=UPI002AAB608B|nr:hypothetical protein [uncultured Methanoregula sp.]